MKKDAYIKTLMLIPAFLITAKKWEQPKCPSTDHTPAMKYLFSHKK